MNTRPTALIAEDEPLLAQTLANELRTLWPALHIAATAGDGLSAVQLALQHRPDVLFFDIRMPGQKRAGRRRRTGRRMACRKCIPFAGICHGL